MQNIFFIFGIFFLAIISFKGQANTSTSTKQSCLISAKEESVLLNQSYDDFDESIEDGGWRFLRNRKCCYEAAELILKYQKKHGKKIKPYQSRVLNFHAGQLYLKSGHNELGLKKIKEAYAQSLPSNDEWNLFVTGTTAFLEKDMARLKSIRAEYVKLRGEKSSKPYGMDPIEYLIRDLAAGEVYGTCQ